MSIPALHPLPAWSTVWRAEIPPRPRPTRKVVLIAAGGFILLTLSTGLVIADDGSLVATGNLGALMGVMFAFEWKSQRQYRFALPVPRPQHALLRGAVRWGMMMVLLAAVFLLPIPVAALLLGALPELLALPLRLWVAPLVSATITFLLFYPVTLHAKRPLLWLLVPFFAFVFGQLLLELSILEPLGRLIDGAMRSLFLATHFDREWSFVPSESWVGAALLWIGIGMSATLVSALLLRER